MIWPNSRPDARVPVRAAVALCGALVCLLSGCSADNPNAGAHPTTHHGPSATGVAALPALPPLVARDTATDHPARVVSKPIQTLTNLIDEALARNGDRSPQARLSSKAAAGDQLIVAWVLGLESPDPGARNRVRVDAVSILHLAKASGLKFGSVLLLATGTTLDHGKRKVSIAVRAKYTENLVRRTDWTSVSPDQVLRMCDDKPAVIAPGYQ